MKSYRLPTIEDASGEYRRRIARLVKETRMKRAVIARNLIRLGLETAESALGLPDVPARVQTKTAKKKGGAQ